MHRVEYRAAQGNLTVHMKRKHKTTPTAINIRKSDAALNLSTLLNQVQDFEESLRSLTNGQKPSYSVAL